MNDNSLNSILKSRSRIFVWDRYMALSFGLPAAGMLVALICCGFIFVGRNVLCIDLYHIYLPLIEHLHDIIYNGQGGVFSWNIGMGINYYTLFLTNVGSPLNAAIALFPKTIIPDLVGVGMVIKTGLCGLCAAWFMRYKTQKSDLVTVAFALMYAMCGYMANYYWNIMWTDLLFLLPLCAIGIEEIINGRGFMVYVLSLTMAMVCNYYIAVQLCIFLFFYFIVRVLTSFSVKRQFAQIVRSALVFGAFSILAAVISAALLLPVWNVLRITSGVADAMPTTWKTLSPVLEVLTNHLAGAKANMRSGGVPHVYAGLLTALMLPIYMFCRRIPLKERILHVLFGVFLLACIDLNIPNFIWHGFHTPNDIPFRFSFTYSFLIVCMAYRAVRAIEWRGREWRQLVAMGVVALNVMLAVELTKSSKNVWMIVATPVLLAAYGSILLLLKRGRLRAKPARTLVLVVLMAEMTFGAAMGTTNCGSMPRDAYIRNMGDYAYLSSYADLLGKDAGFFRTEIVKSMTLNDGSIYGYRGMSHFSSMLCSDFQDVMRRFGYHTYMYGTTRANRILYRPNTPVIDSILGVRYLMSRGETPYERELWPQVEESAAGVKLYENKYALPIAFLANNELMTEWDFNNADPFAVQQEFVDCALGDAPKLFEYLEPDSFSGDKLTVTEGANGMYQFSESDTSDPGKLTLHYTVDETKPLFIFVSGEQQTYVETKLRDDVQSDEVRYPHVIDCGDVNPGDTLEVNVTLGRDRASGSATVTMVALDFNAYAEAMDALAAGGMQDVAFSSTRVSGHVTAQNDRILFTSIPYDAGWVLYIDGERNEMETIDGAFLAARIPAGAHNVEFRFELQGFALGLKLTLLGIALLIAAYVLFCLRRGDARLTMALEYDLRWPAVDILCEDLPEAEPAACDDTSPDAPVDAEFQASGDETGDEDTAEEVNADE